MSKKNVYVCENGHSTVTINNSGVVTPMFATCPKCKTRMTSQMHPPHSERLTPTHEFFIPKSVEEVKEACEEIYGKGILDMKDFATLFEDKAVCFRKIKTEKE